MTYVGDLSLYNYTLTLLLTGVWSWVTKDGSFDNCRSKV